MRAIAVLSVLAVFFLSACTKEDAAKTSGAEGGNTTLIKLHVEGMSCSKMCPPNIVADLEKVDGVKEVNVDFPTSTATVTTTGDVDSGALVKSLRDQFTATVKN